IIPLKCGEETAIPATKTYTSTLMIFFQLALKLATMRKTLNLEEINQLKQQFTQIPDLISAYLPEQLNIVKDLAKILEKEQNILLLGRDNDYGTALEGALKIQETSYTHAQGFFTGEFKHGPRALINEQTPIIMITNCEHDTYKMTLKDAELYQKQGGLLIGVTQKTLESNGIFAQILPIANISPILAPILNIIPLQMLACHLALIRGLDPDHPRNLTKAVTN
ncbi:MAG TPA: SIS domain-containing protein, partial [Allocoleopsis sp.]